MSKKNSLGMDLAWNISILMGTYASIRSYVFFKLAHFYEKHNNFGSAIDVYESLVRYLLKYQPHCFLRTSIEPIVMKLVQHFKKKSEPARAITILRQLTQLTLTEPADDKCQIDEQFKKIIKNCDGEIVLVTQAYLVYLEVILRHKFLPPNSYICAIKPAFYEAISVYQTRGSYQKATETCQQFVELLINSKTDRSTTEAGFKRLALDFDALSTLETAFHMYTYLGKFIIKHRNIDDLVLSGFVITRCKFLKQKDAIISDDTQQMLMDLMKFYHNAAEPKFVLNDYLKTTKGNYERSSATGVYISLLEFCLKHRSEHHNQYIKAMVATLIDQPKVLISFITTNCINYKELILALFERYGNRIVATYISEQPTVNFETSACRWLSEKEVLNDAYWNQLFYYLFEWQSQYDAYLASCYLKMDDMNAAASIFDMELYEQSCTTI